MEEQREYWDSVADKKTFTIPFQTEEFLQFVPKNGVILDVGCGYGRMLNELYQLGYRKLIGMDFSENMITRGKEQYPYLDLRTMGESKIDLSDGCVDCAILVAVLTCNIKEEDQKKLLREIDGVLRPGGVLYVCDFLLNSDERNLVRYAEGEKKYGTYGVFEMEGVAMRHHERAYLERLLSGYEKLSDGQFVCKTMNGNTANGYYRFARKTTEK